MDKIIIVLEGGIVQEVKGLPAGTTYAIHDYDIEGADPEHDAIGEDEQGREYVRIEHVVH